MASWLGRVAMAAVLLLGALAVSQTAPPQTAKPSQTLPDAPKPQNLPDAPSTTVPPSSFPAGTAPAPKPQPQAPPTDSPTDGPTPPPQQPQVVTVPPGQATKTPANAQDQIYRYTTNVNFVVVPVTVKNASGYLMEGLLPSDFMVLENGAPQQLRFFSSDPFPLSAAVVIDVGMPDSALQKVTQTLSALAGAFSQYDELALYTYGNTVKRVSGFGVVNDNLMKTLRRVKKEQHGAMGGPPVMGGPLGQTGPTVNGRPLDPSQPGIPVPTSQEQSRVLNDAVLQAARDLAKRDRARRRIIFIVSDGREIGSNASYTEVLKVLLSEQIQVYGLGVDSAALPIYKDLQKVHIPGRGTGDILPKYASATGGQVFDEFSQKAIETAYARITEEARNQYTLGYNTRASLSNDYRSIEVKVLHHGADLKIYAKDGYYPLPPVPAVR